MAGFGGDEYRTNVCHGGESKGVGDDADEENEQLATKFPSTYHVRPLIHDGGYEALQSTELKVN